MAEEPIASNASTSASYASITGKEQRTDNGAKITSARKKPANDRDMKANVKRPFSVFLISCDFQRHTRQTHARSVLGSRLNQERTFEDYRK